MKTVRQARRCSTEPHPLSSRPGSRSPVVFGSILLIGLVLCHPCFAQISSVSERVRLVQDESRRELEQTTFLKLPTPAYPMIDVGGWASLTYIDFSNDDHQKALPDLTQNVIIQDYRLWLKAALSERFNGLVRLRNQDYIFRMASDVTSPDMHQQEGLELDQAYVDYTGNDHLTARLGRQYVRVGRGLVLSADLDGAGAEYSSPDWRCRAFAGRTVRRDPNIDNSILGYAQATQDRDFFFLESTRQLTSGHRVYGYTVIQQDSSKSLDPVQAAKDFHYNSQYMGIGASGRVHPLLHYFLEIVRENGRMMIDLPTTPRQDIEATSLLSGLLYYPKWFGKPLVSLEYAFGSGDSARSSVTNTFGGKLTNTTDHNFLYFGSYDGGLALSPRLSNLHVLRLGYQYKPWVQDAELVPDLLLGTKMSLYWKDTADGLISDSLAVMASRDIGSAIDLFVAFRPYSDFSLMLHGGRFMPGDAYASGADDATDRLLATGTLSF